MYPISHKKNVEKQKEFEFSKELTQEQMEEGSPASANEQRRRFGANLSQEDQFQFKLQLLPVVVLALLWLGAHSHGGCDHNVLFGPCGFTGAIRVSFCF